MGAGIDFFIIVGGPAENELILAQARLRSPSLEVPFVEVEVLLYKFRPRRGSLALRFLKVDFPTTKPREPANPVDEPLANLWHCLPPVHELRVNVRERIVDRGGRRVNRVGTLVNLDELFTKLDERQVKRVGGLSPLREGLASLLEALLDPDAPFRKAATKPQKPLESLRNRVGRQINVDEPLTKRFEPYVNRVR